MEIRYTINPDCIFTITNSEIIGIATANHQDIINYLSLSAKEKIEVLVDNKKLSLDELESLKRKTAIITEKIFYNIYRNSRRLYGLYNKKRNTSYEKSH